MESRAWREARYERGVDLEGDQKLKLLVVAGFQQCRENVGAEGLTL